MIPFIPCLTYQLHHGVGSQTFCRPAMHAQAFAT
jgi:hypothetical protein